MTTDQSIFKLVNSGYDHFLYTRKYLPTSPSKQLMDWTILTDPKEAHHPMRVPE